MQLIYPGQGPTPSYLTNKIPGPVNVSQALSDSDQMRAAADNAAKQTFNTQYDEHQGESTMQRLVRFGSAGIVDTVDTIASIAPFIERGDIWELTKSIDTSGLADWQARNKSGVEISSAVLTSIAGGYMAERYIIGSLGSRLLASSALSNSSVVAASANYMAKARAAALATQEAAAESGTVASLLAPGIPKLLALHAAKNFGHAAVSEATILTLGHNNEALWTDDMANNIFWTGLGLAIPTAIGLVQGRAAVRMSANDPSILMKRSQARDPHGYVRQRDISADPTLPRNHDLVLDPAAKLTQSAMEWRQSIDVGNPTPILRSARSSFEVQMHEQVQADLIKLTSIPDPHSNMRKLSIGKNGKDTSQQSNIVLGLTNDPTLMMEVQTLGTGSVRGTVVSRQNEITRLRTPGPDQNLHQADELAKEIPFVLIEGRWHLANREANDFASFDPRSVRINSKGTFEYEVIPQGQQTGKILNMSAKVKNFTRLPVTDRLAYTQGLVKLSKSVRTSPVKTRPSMFLEDTSDFLQHEFAIHHILKGGDIDLSKSSYKSLEDVRFGALKTKIAQMKQDGVYGGYMDQWTRKRYNLPAASEVELIEDGSSKALNTVLNQVDTGKIGTYQEAKELYNEILTRHEMIAQTRAPIREFEGRMWEDNFSPTGQWYEPVIAWHKPRTMDPLKRGLRAQLAEAIANNKQYVYQELMAPHVENSAVRNTSLLIHQTPEGQNLTDISGLANNQITGTGAGPGAEAGAFLPVTHRVRDSKKLTSAVRAAQLKDDIADAVTRLDHEMFGDTVTRITSSVNKRSLALVDQAVSFKPGWDLQNGFVKTADTFPDGSPVYKILLDDKSAWNAERLGRPVVPGEFFMNHNTGKDIAFDELAKEYWEKFTDRGFVDPVTKQFKMSLTEKMRLEENKVRAAMGLSEIRHAPHHIPSQNTRNKFVGFVMNSKGEVKPGMTVVEDTAEAFARSRSKLEAQIQNDPSLHFHTKAEIASTLDIWDQAQMYWVDAHFIGRKNVSAKGNLVGDRIRQNTVSEHMQYIRDKNLALASSTMRAALSDQIQIAKMYRHSDRLQAGEIVEGDAKLAKVGTHTIWDDYLKAVAGPASAEVANRRVTNQLIAAEDALQPWVDAAWTGVNKLPLDQVTAYVKDIFTRFGANSSTSNLGKKQSFAQLTEALGPHMPYSTIGDFIEQTRNAKRPPAVAEITSKMNRLTASFVLRYLELPNAAMNMLGVIGNTQATIGNTPVLGQLVDGAGRKINVFDRMGILMSGTKEWFRKTHNLDWEYAAKHGGLEPGIAEVRRTMAAIDNSSDWKRVFLGDKSIKNAKRFTPDWIRYHGVDGIMSIMNDSTESWSRQWSHAIGLKLADYQGITGEAARFNFANSIADATIANYSPLNRGEVFQTALGSLGGLFQTYAMNYNSRMFRYLELGDHAAAMRQVAAQSLMFGTSSNLGWNELESLESMFSGRDNESTLSDVIYAKYGPLVGSTIAHGGVADLAMLFGAPTGIAIYQRADTNIRTNVLPGSDGKIDPFKMAAALSMVKNLGDALWEIGTMPLKGDSSLMTGRHVSEVLSQELPNRTLKGAISLIFNDGTEVDKYGAVTATTQGYFEGLLKGMGLRSTRQQDEIEYKYANRASLDKQAAQMEELRKQTRESIRANGFEKSAADIWQAYLDKGGNPMMFKSWVRQNMEAATTTSGLREFQKGLNSPKMQLYIARYGWSH